MEITIDVVIDFAVEGHHSEIQTPNCAKVLE
jgi:hypothetical protein